MNAADIAQIASAAFTALAAGAAWLTVRHAESQNETSRAALNAQTQPLLTDLPYGVFRAPVRRTTVAGTRLGTDEWEDEAEIRVGTYSTRRGDGPSFGASLAVRNVGHGAARIQRAVFSVGPEQVAAHIANPVVPPGEFTRLGFMIDYDASAAASRQ